MIVPAHAPVSVTYALTREDLRRLRAELPGGVTFPTWGYALIAVALAADVAPGAKRGGVAEAWFVGTAALAAVTAAGLLAAAAVLARRRVGPGRFAVHADERGLAVARDGRARRIPWRAVVTARRTPHAVVLRCRGLGYVFVPRDVLGDDGAALWALLEDVLVSKSGLTVPSGERTLLVNSLR